MLIGEKFSHDTNLGSRRTNHEGVRDGSDVELMFDDKGKD